MIQQSHSPGNILEENCNSTRYMLTAALFTVGKTWKQPEHPLKSMEEEDAFTMEYYSINDPS